MVVRQDGNVGIGTTTPTAKLAIHADALPATLLQVEAPDGKPIGGYTITPAGVPIAYVSGPFIVGDGPSVQLLTLNGCAANDCAGKPGGGSWTDSSDARLKHNVVSLSSVLARVLRLRGVSYEWNEPEKHGNLTGPQIGMIAQEVEEIFPEWIGVDPNGYRTLTFRGFEALTVESLRELKIHNDALSASNSELREELSSLKQRVAGFENDSATKRASIFVDGAWTLTFLLGVGLGAMGLWLHRRRQGGPRWFALRFRAGPRLGLTLNCTRQRASRRLRLRLARRG